VGEKMNELATLENVLVNGDLANLTPEQRIVYYKKRCEASGLDPMSVPFNFIRLQGKMVLYANKGCAEQLRNNNGLSIRITARELIGDIYVVTAAAQNKDGRVDESTGAVNIKGLSGDNLANAYLKAETKAKRRVTLSFVGMGMPDESEVGSIKDKEYIEVDFATGEIVKQTQQPKQIEDHGSKKITKDQAMEISKLLFDTKTNSVKFLSYYKVKAIEDLSVDSYYNALLELHKKLRGLTDSTLPLPPGAQYAGV
jgi:hypothetical protein